MSEHKKTARKVTDIIIGNMDTKIHAGEWVRIDTVRRALHEIIEHYETKIHGVGEEE